MLDRLIKYSIKQNGEIKEPSTCLFRKLAWITPTERWNFHNCLAVFKSLKGFYPSYLKNLFSLSNSIQDGGASRQYFGFRSSRAATALHVSKKNITFCFDQG